MSGESNPPRARPDRPPPRLLAIDARLLELLRGPAPAFETDYGAKLGSQAAAAASLSAQMLERCPRDPRGAPSGGYLAASADGEIVGICGFKSPPDAARTIEIAYSTFPPHEGRGHARSMARALVEQCKASGAVDVVRAHTLPERNASVHVLERNGFEFQGSVEDPEDGIVWRWELKLPR